MPMLDGFHMYKRLLIQMDLIFELIPNLSCLTVKFTSGDGVDLKQMGLA